MVFDEMPKLAAEFDPANSQSYEATCHCGTVQYTVTLSPPLDKLKVVSCNCSICARNGYLLVYPWREHLVVKSGEEELKAYQFGKKQNLHKFCAKCGSSVFFDPQLEEPNIMGVNVRMFKNVNLKALDLVDVDGWNGWPFIDADHLK